MIVIANRMNINVNIAIINNIIHKLYENRLNNWQEVQLDLTIRQIINGKIVYHCQNLIKYRIIMLVVVMIRNKHKDIHIVIIIIIV